MVFQYVTHLDRFLERHYNVLVKQPKAHIDWLADPQRRNNTWGPWLSVSDRGMIYGTNAVTSLGTVAACFHIGMLLFIVGLGKFV